MVMLEFVQAGIANIGRSISSTADCLIGQGLATS